MLIIGALLVQCVPANYQNYQVQIGDTVFGRVRGVFRETYWNYYARGVSYAEGGYYYEEKYKKTKNKPDRYMADRLYWLARADFLKCIDLWAQDGRLTPSYGMHLIDYFPHRELGLLYYRQDDLKQAKTYLIQSIEQYPSAKAQVYLDEIRKRMLAQEKAPAGNKPVIRFNPSVRDGEIWTNLSSIEITGTVTDERFVDKVWFGDERLFLEGADKQIHFRRKIDLSFSTNTVCVKAVNLDGEPSMKELRIHVDRIGPVVSIESIEPGIQSGTLRLSGKATDDRGVREIRIDGQTIWAGCQQSRTFEHAVAISAAVVTIHVSDRAGNTTQLLVEPAKYLQGANPPLMAMAGCSDVPLIIGRNPLSLVPKIELKGVFDGSIVYQPNIPLHIIIEPARRLKRLTIKGEDIPVPSGKKVVTVSHMLALNLGHNTITINATVTQGNLPEPVQIKIERRQPPAHKLKYRLAAHVGLFHYYFRDRLLTENEVADAFKNGLLRELNALHVAGNPRFRIKRSENELDRGDLLINGEIKINSYGINVTADIFEDGVGEPLCSAGVFYINKKMEKRSLPENAAWFMAARILLEFPLVEGFITDRKKNDIETSFGYSKKLDRRKLLISKKDGEILGLAKVFETYQDRLVAEISKANLEISRGDHVIFK